MSCTRCSAPSLLVCIDCSLSLYCSPTCATQSDSHPCALVQYLIRGNSPPNDLWDLGGKNVVLDNLYTFSLPSNSFEELLNRGVCYSTKAFLYLWNHTADLFVWPHEKEAHMKWLGRMAAKLVALDASIDQPTVSTWSKDPFDVLIVLSPFLTKTKNADLIASTFNSGNLHRFIFCEESHPFKFLQRLLETVSLPFLYHPFHVLTKLTATPKNCTLFSSFEGPRHVVRPLLCQTWHQASFLSAQIRLPARFIFSTNRPYWHRSRILFLFYLDRRKALLQICSRRNTHLVTDRLPPFQDWTWAA